ncbi:MAG: hypothetical protein LBD23_09015 [Oscillospiraceae bacterium]|jgi:hypothetical protein|nr:hypothetical protein [Oscillospiraceae bacterium]
MAMTLKALYEKLNALNPLILTDSEDTKNVFLLTLFALKRTELMIENHSITFSDTRIDITGWVDFGIPKGRFVFSMVITKAEAGGTRAFTVAFEAAADVNGNLDDVFGTIYPTYHRQSEMAEYKPLLEDATVSGRFSLNYTSGDFEKLPIRFSCSNVTLPDGLAWQTEPFCALLNAAGASGTLSGRMSPDSYLGFIYFNASLELDKTYTKLLPSTDVISAFIGLQNGVSGTEDTVVSFTEREPLVSQVYMGLRFNLKGLSNEIKIIAPLFRGDEFIAMGADFGEGLSPADMINFIAALFGGTPNGLMLPAMGFLDSFGLKTLSVTLRKPEGSMFPMLYAISPYISTKRPIELFIPNIILNSLDLSFLIQWGYNDNCIQNRQLTVEDASGRLITADIGAEVSLKLPNNTTIVLIARSTLPDLEFSGVIRFYKENGLKDANTASMVMGDTVAGTLPGITLAVVYVTAGYTSRSLSLDATVYDAIEFDISGLKVKLKQINAGASFTQSGNSFYIGGIIAFTPKKYQNDGFSFSLRAAFGNGVWLFEGGLLTGKVHLAALINSILGIENIPAVLEDIQLTEFKVRYQYSNKAGAINPFSLRATVTGDFSKLFDGFSVKLGCSAAIETTEKDELIVSALTWLDIGSFTATAQLDGLGTDLASYIFTFMYREKGLRAALYTADKKRFLTMNLLSITLGDIVDFFIRIVDPRYESKLPAPLDGLYKIDLSKFTLTYGLDDGTLALKYDVNLNLVVIQVNSIGVKYEPADKSKGTPADVFMTLEVKSLLSSAANDETSESWSLLRGLPPAFGGKGGVSFNMEYLGLVARFNNSDESLNILAANTIPQALERIAGSKDIKPDLAKYDPAVNFAFATHFIVNNAVEFKLALVDPSIYGFYITINSKDKGGLLEQFNGLYMELLYKRISDELGMFKASFVLPDKWRKLQLGAMSVTLGLVVVEIYTDGGFYIDLGFPHNRDFSRSFLLQFGLFTGRAGLYFGILSSAAVTELPDWGNGRFAPVIKLGVGVTFGIGRSFDFGIVTGGFELSAAGIFEGTLAFWIARENSMYESDGSTVYYKLSATLGIIGRLHVKVDFKIIALTASVEFCAFAHAVFETDKPVIIDLDLNLKLSGSVKILFIKINFSYSFSYSAHFEIGGKNVVYALPPLNISALSLGKKAIVNWFLAHSPAMNGLTAFVPMMRKDQFLPLYEKVVALCLSPMGDVLDRETAAGYNSDYVYANIDIDGLYNFINANILFNIISPDRLEGDDDETEGYVLALPPLVKLKISHITEDIDIIERDFNEFNPVTDEYINKIHEYFKNLSDEDDNFLKAESVPIAKVIFYDYFCSIARQIYGEIRQLFEGYTIPLTMGLDDIARKYGISPIEIAESNSNLKIQKGARLSVGLTYICPERTSFSALPFILDGTGLWEQLSQRHILANTSITVESFSFESAYDKKLTAAFVFTRWFGEQIETHWQKHFDDILAALNRPFDWECTVSGECVFTYDGITWSAMPGDTAERLAKIFTLYFADSGYFPAFDDFLGKVTVVSGAYNFPETIIAVHSAETPAQLMRRVYKRKNGEFIKHLPVIEKFASLPLAGVVLECSQEQTLHDFAEEHNNDYGTIASCIEPHHFAAGQCIDIKPKKIPKADIEEYLRNSDAAKRTGAFVSRILTQGLRVPKEHEEGTLAYYELCGMQFGLDSGSYEINIESHDGTFVTGTSIYAVEVDKSVQVANSFRNEISVTEIEPFAENAWTHQASEKLICGSKVLRFMPDNSFKEYKLSYSDAPGVEIDYEKALCLPFTVKRQRDNVLHVVGLSPVDRQKLRNLLDETSKQELHYSVYYEPGRLTGITGVLLNTNFGAGERFIKTNLSRETKLNGISNIDKYAAVRNNYICNLDDELFAQMLWECSVTCGNYPLFISSPNKLPPDIFDENDTVQLYILLTGESVFAQANCVLSYDRQNAGKDAYFWHENELTASPALPCGFYGLRIKYTPEDDSVSQILGYTITLGSETSNLSKPLIPIDCPKTGDTIYEPVFAIGEHYEDFGEAMANIELRDIFGNQSPTPMSYPIRFRVNDFIIAINEWAGLTCSYKFLPGKIIITLAATDIGEGFILSKEGRKVLEHALTQQQKCDFSLYLVTTLAQKEHGEAVEILLTNPLTKFLDNILNYYAGMNGELPTETIIIPIEETDLPLEPIFPVLVTLRMKRNAITIENPPLAAVLSDTVVSYKPDENESSEAACEFPVVGYALAHKNLSDKDLFAINLNECVITPKLDFRGYFAQAPLASALIDGADVNIWARIFLDDFENVLANIETLANCRKEDVEALLDVKERLAEKIAQSFVEVYSGQEAPVSITAFVSDMLMENINSEISSIGVYSRKVNSVTNQLQARLSVELSRLDNERVVSKPGKLSGSDEFIIAYSAYSRYESNFEVVYDSAKATHFEYAIKAGAFGYESSEWYSFLRPIELDAFSGITGTSKVPNPLREIPSSPKLSNSRFVTHKQIPLNLPGCDYRLDIDTILPEQDEILLRICWGSLGKYTRVHSEENIYTALKVYMDVRDSLMLDFNTDCLVKFTEFAKKICDSWKPMPNLTANLSDNSLSAVIHWQNHKLVCDSAEVSLSYDEALLPGEKMTVCLSVPNLSVYEKTSAVPYAKVARNAEFAPLYRFSTEEVSMPEIPSQNDFDFDIDLGTIGGWDDGGINLKCQKLYDALQIPSQLRGLLYIESELTYAYTHINSAAPIRLPIAMFKDAALVNIQRTVKKWFNSARPSVNAARLELSVRVYNGDRSVLTVCRMIVR